MRRIAAPSHVRLVPILLVLWSATSIARAELYPDEAPLAGVKSTAVLIENLSAQEADIISQETLLTDVELKLRLAGINVVSRDSVNLKTPLTYLNVHILTIETTPLHYVYNIELHFEQSATLIRNPHIVALGASTWHRGLLGHTPPDDASGRIRSAVKDLLDQFINSYLKANPRRVK